MPGKKEATGEDEKVEDKVERAENVVDNVGSSRHIPLTAHCVRSANNINVQDEVELSVDSCREGSRPEDAGNQGRLLFELKYLVCLVQLDGKDTQEVTDSEGNPPGGKYMLRIPLSVHPGGRQAGVQLARSDLEKGVNGKHPPKATPKGNNDRSCHRLPVTNVHPAITENFKI